MAWQSPITTVKDVWHYRDLLVNLVSKELSVRYKGSVLGFAWSLVTPLLMAAIFTVVFLTFLRIPFGKNGNFTTFFLSGYLAWQFFQNSVMASANSIISNGSLIKKVYFPRELLPLALVISQVIHLSLALLATAPLFWYFRGFHPTVLLWLIPALLLMALFTAGISMLFGALTVTLRDLTEFLPVLMQAWFYLTPVIYSLENIRLIDAQHHTSLTTLILCNPMSWFIELFHTVLYGIPLPPDVGDIHPGPTTPDLTTWLIVMAMSLASFALGYAIFVRSARTFAKEV